MALSSSTFGAVAFGLLASCVTGAAFAQSGIATVAAGKEIRISSHEVFNKSCAPGPVVEIKATTPPKHGTFLVRTATVKTSAGSPCPNKDWPTQAVFYAAKAGYSGPDALTYQVKSPAGKMSSHSVAVTVTP